MDLNMEDYQSIFQRLWQHEENEVVEFKKASNSYDFEKLGKYFSALSNEANLLRRRSATVRLKTSSGCSAGTLQA